MKPGVERPSELLVAGFLLEAILLTTTLAWAWHSHVSFPLLPDKVEVLHGLGLAFPLLAFNAALFLLPLSRLPWLREIHEFQAEFVLPLARHFSFVSAFLISLAAGLGEEFFFRGMIQTNLGIVLASLLFALLHFGVAARRFKLTVAIYILIGFYFGLIYQQTNSIWTVVVCHASYDFAALIYLRYFRRPT